MTERESAAYRQLWAAVALTALSEHRSRIHAAAKGRRSIYVPGNYLAALGTHEEEMAAAKAYIASADFVRICDMAGVLPKAPEALDYLIAATERFSIKAIQERAA